MTISFFSPLADKVIEKEPTQVNFEMTEAELKILKLLEGKELRAPHPITVLNPQEWFKAVAVEVGINHVSILGEYTCWWNLKDLEVRDKQNG